MDYIDTPQTDAGNAARKSNAYDLENISIAESSFSSPSKHKDDLMSEISKARGTSLKTPRSRVPFTDRRNLPTTSRGDFTPLLKSVVKNNVLRKSKLGGDGPQTPAFLKDGYVDSNSVALPTVESVLYEEDTQSSAERLGNGSPVPQFVSSSIASTPLPELSKRDAGGVLTGQGSMMTLREQENVRFIDRMWHLATSADHFRIDYQSDRQGKLWAKAQNPLFGGGLTKGWT